MSDRRHWKEDSTTSVCEYCGEQFALFRRRHHCRICGGVFCDTCSNHRVIITSRLGDNEGERACIACVKVTQLATSSPVVRPREVCKQSKSALCVFPFHDCLVFVFFIINVEREVNTNQENSHQFVYCFLDTLRGTSSGALSLYIVRVKIGL